MKKVGLVGFGIWGRNILRDLISIGVKVLVFDPEESKKKEASELGASFFSTNWNASHQVDAWIISSPAITHFEVLIDLIPSDKPIFVEKPLTCSLEEAIELEKYVDRPIFVMHNWRYHGGIKLLSEIVKSGELGDLRFFKSNRCNWTSPRSDVDSVWTLIPHDITIAYSILGHFPEPISAVEETYRGIARGMTAILGKSIPCVFEVSNRYFDKRREVRLHFEKGVAVLPDEKVDYIEIYFGDDRSKPDSVQMEKRKFEARAPLFEELSQFIDFLGGGKEPPTSLSEGIMVIKTIARLKELSRLK
ncbi:Gfo/Idh/MocA family oxidoreductase [uncultured Algoriphagus sp.]|uniref:Gfo/Idh/MocA family protein n=1 Tax=uncultured Algoriphagus sp. TaxID=417365 RepID=UPI00258D5975|nr:Gfo/Idh/MocA family oxidoreductase [uncultured Algoriphagus sp.]